MKKKYTKRHRQEMMKFRKISIRIFAVMMLVGGVTGMLFFFRPDRSNVEMRELTKFPKLTLSSVLDGSFFSELSLWYSDTYPMRDVLIAADQKLKTAYGVTSSTMMVGGHKQGDEIPVNVAQNDQESETEQDGQSEQSDEPVQTQDTLADQTQGETETVSAPNSREMEEEIQNQIQQGLYVKMAPPTVFTISAKALRILIHRH